MSRPTAELIPSDYQREAWTNSAQTEHAWALSKVGIHDLLPPRDVDSYTVMPFNDAVYCVTDKNPGLLLEDLQRYYGQLCSFDSLTPQNRTPITGAEDIVGAPYTKIAHAAGTLTLQSFKDSDGKANYSVSNDSSRFPVHDPASPGPITRFALATGRNLEYGGLGLMRITYSSKPLDYYRQFIPNLFDGPNGDRVVQPVTLPLLPVTTHLGRILDIPGEHSFKMAGDLASHIDSKSYRKGSERLDIHYPAYGLQGKVLARLSARIPSQHPYLPEGGYHNGIYIGLACVLPALGEQQEFQRTIPGMADVNEIDHPHIHLPSLVFEIGPDTAGMDKLRALSTLAFYNTIEKPLYPNGSVSRIENAATFVYHQDTARGE